MAKIILIDDRKQRKYDHLDRKHVERLLECVDYNIELPDINQDRVYDFRKLDSYDIIAIHRSYLAQNGLLPSFSEYMKGSKSYFILFSGGFSQNVISDNSKLLKINSIDFYSEKTISFFEKIRKSEIEEDSYILLKLLYGENWKLPLLLRARSILWKYSENDLKNLSYSLNENEEIENLKGIFPDSSLDFFQREIKSIFNIK